MSHMHKYSLLICPLLDLLLLLIEVLRLPGYCSQVFGGLHVSSLSQRGLQATQHQSDVVSCYSTAGLTITQQRIHHSDVVSCYCLTGSHTAKQLSESCCGPLLPD